MVRMRGIRSRSCERGIHKDLLFCRLFAFCTHSCARAPPSRRCRRFSDEEALSIPAPIGAPNHLVSPGEMCTWVVDRLLVASYIVNQPLAAFILAEAFFCVFML